MRRDKYVGFREEKKIVDRIDVVVEDQGIDRSDFLRQAVREKLKNTTEG